MTWAIGNGESRRNIKIDHLTEIKVGCNAIARDYAVDHLICVDRRMVDEAVALNTASIVYTRQDWYDRYKNSVSVKTVPKLPYNGHERWDQPFQWGSGPYAVLLAAKLSNDTVNIIGFDLYSKDKKINNIYKDTKNYDSSEKSAIDSRYWVHQISMVFKCFPKISFNIYQEQDWQLPDQWKYSNVSVDEISNIRYY